MGTFYRKMKRIQTLGAYLEETGRMKVTGGGQAYVGLSSKINEFTVPVLNLIKFLTQAMSAICVR